MEKGGSAGYSGEQTHAPDKKLLLKLINLFTYDIDFLNLANPGIIFPKKTPFHNQQFVSSTIKIINMLSHSNYTEIYASQKYVMLIVI